MQRDANDLTKIDEALISRIASMSRGSQRWVKTALQAISLSDDAVEDTLEPRRDVSPGFTARR